MPAGSCSTVAKPGNGGGSCETRRGRKLAMSDAGTCRWQGASGRGGSAVGVAGFRSVLGCGARTGMPGSAQQLKGGVWGRGIQAGGGRTSVIGTRPGTLGPFEVDVSTTAGGRGTNRSVIRGWDRRQRRLGDRPEKRDESRLPFDSEARSLGRFQEAKASDRKCGVTSGALENQAAAQTRRRGVSLR